MIRSVIYTQRVEMIESYQERRDCADQNIPRFIERCGYLPIPISNVLSSPEAFIHDIKPAGIILTGGNSLEKYGGDAPERDKTDRLLLKIAIKENIPVYGICRGMQSILDYFDCILENVKGHAAVRHQVEGAWGSFEVNSYHNQACLSVKEPLQAAAVSSDGVIEAVECLYPRITATMWHPERERDFAFADIERVRRLFE